MKTEDLKNYIFEQCLTEKMHPLVMRGAQWVADNIGGDAKKLAHRMSRGINKTTNEPTPQHVYNAAQFHFGEILRKNSPSMDRPEIYADMRTRLRAHLGLDGEVNETSDLAAGNLEDHRRRQAIGNYDLAARVGREMVRDYQETGIWDPDLKRDRQMFSDRMDKAFASAQRAQNRRMGKRGDGSPRTPKQESAFNFINGLKRLTETSPFAATRLRDARKKQAADYERTGEGIARAAGNYPQHGGNQSRYRTLPFNSTLVSAHDIVMKQFRKARRSAERAENRLNGLRGDGSELPPVQPRNWSTEGDYPNMADLRR